MLNTEKHDVPGLVDDQVSPTTHWHSQRAISFCLVGRRPRTVVEWLTCGWNADVFYGPVPILKTITVVSWLIAWGV